MKTRLLIALSLFGLAACSVEYSSSEDVSEASGDTAPESVPASEVELVSLQGEQLEVGCGKCTYDMPGVESCMTAAVIDGKPVLVNGVGANAHAHGLCAGPKQASVTGDVGPDGLTVTELKFEEG